MFILAKINERHVLQVIRELGPSSRAEIARHSGLSAPTVSKAAASLQKARLLEEVEGNGQLIGRPAMKLRLATLTAQVLGIVIDVNRCSIVASGLDGEISRGPHAPGRDSCPLSRPARRPGQAGAAP